MYALKTGKGCICLWFFDLYRLPGSDNFYEKGIIITIAEKLHRMRKIRIEIALEYRQLCD